VQYSVWHQTCHYRHNLAAIYPLAKKSLKNDTAGIHCGWTLVLAIKYNEIYILFGLVSGFIFKI
jgi:hypothetical protein